MSATVDLLGQIVFVLDCVCGCNRAREYRMTTKKMYRYTKDTLLAFASLPSCQPRPDGIDPVLWRYIATLLCLLFSMAFHFQRCLGGF